jgi:hypothetical protein
MLAVITNQKTICILVQLRFLVFPAEVWSFSFALSSIIILVPLKLNQKVKQLRKYR